MALRENGTAIPTPREMAHWAFELISFQACMTYLRSINFCTTLWTDLKVLIAEILLQVFIAVQVRMEFIMASKADELLAVWA